ncbi:MAG: RNA polymerase sigma factor [Lunatimonas sp.]|uniref:RNA polymerase sigma factor n=1 Tax=Lunatimonas sp. TaxID=2060141 RepID=UPI00263B970A|nr:RNA polymerase sigma factor [Lunatimonas sp.]MCC5939789.1 RNA polymerase sigma factor [Lunatimonas sp.]
MKSFFENQIWPLRHKLYRLAYLWVKDRDLAKDILQTVFEKALAKEEVLAQVQNPTGWMVRALKNESLHQVKLQRRNSGLEGIELAYPPAEDEVPDPRAEWVLRFVRSLPEKQREIFHLREMEGLTYTEIADYLEVPVEQVKVNLHRARKTLRDFLNQIQHGK